MNGKVQTTPLLPWYGLAHGCFMTTVQLCQVGIGLESNGWQDVPKVKQGMSGKG